MLVPDVEGDRYLNAAHVAYTTRCRRAGREQEWICATRNGRVLGTISDRMLERLTGTVIPDTTRSHVRTFFLAGETLQQVTYPVLGWRVRTNRTPLPITCDLDPDTDEDLGVYCILTTTGVWVFPGLEWMTDETIATEHARRQLLDRRTIARAHAASKAPVPPS